MAYPNCHFCNLGSLSSKTKGTWTQALRYCNSWSDAELVTKWLKGGDPMQHGYTWKRDDSHPMLERVGQPKISSWYSEWYEIENFWIFYVWNFSINIFRLWLTGGTETMGSKTMDQGDCYSFDYLKRSCLESETESPITLQWLKPVWYKELLRPRIIICQGQSAFLLAFSMSVLWIYFYSLKEANEVQYILRMFTVYYYITKTENLSSHKMQDGI